MAKTATPARLRTYGTTKVRHTVAPPVGEGADGDMPVVWPALASYVNA